HHYTSHPSPTRRSPDLGIWIQLRGTRFGAGSQLRLVVACEDITEVKAAETSLRRLPGKLLKSQDEARRLIARFQQLAGQPPQTWGRESPPPNPRHLSNP